MNEKIVMDTVDYKLLIKEQFFISIVDLHNRPTCIVHEQNSPSVVA